MAAEEAEQQVGQPVDYQQPRQGEMPVAREPKARAARQRCPIGKSAGDRFAVGPVSDAEHAGGDEIVPRDRGHADRLVGLDVFERRDRNERRHAAVAVLSPVQRRMIVEQPQAAHQQQHEQQRINPVGQPHRDAVAVNDFTASAGRCGGRRRRRRGCSAIVADSLRVDSMMRYPRRS